MISTREKFAKVFLADDDSDDVMMFSDALKEVSGETILTTAYDGQNLLEILDNEVPPPPDVIFLDLNMPRKNGFECLTAIRSTPKLQNIPVVIFSTSNRADFVKKTFEEGANQYICKPSTYAGLKNAIRSVLNIDWSQALPPASVEAFLKPGF